MKDSKLTFCELQRTMNGICLWKNAFCESFSLLKNPMESNAVSLIKGDFFLLEVE